MVKMRGGEDGDIVKGGGRNLDSVFLGMNPRLYHSLAVGIWRSYAASMNFSFPI